MTHKTDIWITHSYGYIEIKFNKVFELPFTPFIGLTILDNTDDYDLDIEFANNAYVSTRIYYHANRNEFEVNIRHHWSQPITDESLDSTINYFVLAGWQRQDHNNIDELKALMKRDYERSKNNRPIL